MADSDFKRTELVYKTIFGGGKKRKTSSSTSVANEYFSTMSEQEKAKYLELRQLFETWGGVTPQMTNIKRMTRLINKIKQSMRLNIWYAKDGMEKTKIIENRDNYCNFCSPEGRDPKPIEALNEWRNIRPEQPMMGGKRKTRRRNKKQRRKKPKRRKKTKRRKKGGYGPERVFTTKSDEALFNARFPNWGDEDIYVSLLKRGARGRSRKIGEGVILSKNINHLTLTDDEAVWGVKDYPWSSFDRIIVHRGRGSLNTFDGA